MFRHLHLAKVACLSLIMYLLLVVTVTTAQLVLSVCPTNLILTVLITDTCNCPEATDKYATRVTVHWHV